MNNNLTNFYPMKMHPVFKDCIWGGKKLNKYNKINGNTNIAESWEISCNNNDLTTIDNGKFKGQIFKNIIETDPMGFLGERCKKFGDFPLIIKFIDAKENLSIQVHPSDFNANKTNNEHGKSELWYILECDENAYIYYGLKNNITSNYFIDFINKENVCNLLNKVYVKKGDMFYIPAGTIHALGKGIVVSEIQQNSNTTFRIYDYNRQDINGNLRELHINKALNVINFNKTTINEKVRPINNVFECNYFNVKKINFSNEKIFHKNSDSFNIVQFISGFGSISSGDYFCEFKIGDTFFIPAKLQQFKIIGDCEILLIDI